MQRPDCKSGAICVSSLGPRKPPSAAGERRLDTVGPPVPDCVSHPVVERGLGDASNSDLYAVDHDPFCGQMPTTPIGETLRTNVPTYADAFVAMDEQ